MKCQFCGNEKKLIKAHIIPEGFFRRLYSGEQPLILVTNKAGEYRRRVPIGVYDRTIVCRDCERIWEPWDNYVQQLLGEQLLNVQVRYDSNGRKLASVVNQFDYKKLKLFFISIIWRASVSNIPFFSRVSLGPFEEVAKTMIYNTNPGSDEDFGVILSRFDHPLGKPIADPYKTTLLDVNYYRFFLASYIADIKVDEKSTPASLSSFTIAHNRPLVIISRNLEKSKDFEVMRKVIRDSYADKV